MPIQLRIYPIRATTAAILSLRLEFSSIQRLKRLCGLFWNSILDTGTAEARATSAVALIRHATPFDVWPWRAGFDRIDKGLVIER
jgi:hypothetical protein